VEAKSGLMMGGDNIRGEDWVHKTIMSVVIEVRK
jgi:hypothetical protein